MYANMTEELLDPKPENQETLCQNEATQIDEVTWRVQESDAVVKAQATLEAKYNRTRCVDWSY